MFGLPEFTQLVCLPLQHRFPCCTAFPIRKKHEPWNPTDLTLDPSSPPSTSPSLDKSLRLQAFVF